MPNVKRISQGAAYTGATIYAIVRRDADSYRLNDADGSFASAPADPYLSLTEDGVIKGLYEKSESRASWNDGEYTIAVYRQAGGSPAPASDLLVGLGRMSIYSDAEITYSTLRITGASSAVWEELLTGHTTSGTMGNFMTKAKNQFGLVP